ncbi:unnamed protein product [Porites evermanni]|uniref:Ribosomal protein S3 n=1 Tax=Porites evermanni TaxID=104178 RepID=A0ABN8NFR6_9CNID|nr:unnamed protein product [Porites evermanni]
MRILNAADFQNGGQAKGRNKRTKVVLQRILGIHPPFIPSENSLVDRPQTFHGQLFREIKKKLWSGRREDPEISIDFIVDQDVFIEGLGSVLPEEKWFTK